MPNLFDPLTINTLEIKNRFVRSATMDMQADQGMVTDELIALYQELVEGETGLIITGGIYIRKDGQIIPGELSADTDESIPSLKRLTDAVHKKGGNCRPASPCWMGQPSPDFRFSTIGPFTDCPSLYK